VVLDEIIVFEAQTFDIADGAVALLIEFLDRIKGIIGVQEFAAFDTEGT